MVAQLIDGMSRDEIPIYAWQTHVAEDIAAVLQLIGAVNSEAFRLAGMLVREALWRERFVPMSLLMLCARAVGVTDRERETLHAFAAAIELINVSLAAHAGLSGGEVTSDNGPLLSLGEPAGVLLGDCLYTQAFELIAGTRNMRAIEEIAALTEGMIVARIRERFPPKGSDPPHSPAYRSLREVVWSACCSIASTVVRGTNEQHLLLHEFGGLCARLGDRWGLADRGGGQQMSFRLDRALIMADRASRLLSRALPASGYREALAILVVDLVMPG